MTYENKFLHLVNKSFPEKPIPSQFFWLDCERALDRDIPTELSNRIAGRSWKNLTLLDWRMVASSPAICRSYMDPVAFIYYIPSLLIGSFREAEYINLSLEAIVPDNKFRVPRGKWWAEFSNLISSTQRATLSAFLSRIRLELWDQIGPTNQPLVEDAERIWSAGKQ